MSVYFERFPNVMHTDVLLKNITLRAKLVDEVKANPLVFLPYSVEDFMRPEEVAFHYYGSVDQTWLLFWANDIIDPYYDWVMPTEVLDNYLYKKYLPYAREYYVDVRYHNSSSTSPSYVEFVDVTKEEVLQWTMNKTIEENIVEYRNVDDEEDVVSVETYPLLPIQSQYRPVRVYEWEEERNENNRHIMVVDKAYVSQIEAGLKKEMKNV